MQYISIDISLAATFEVILLMDKEVVHLNCPFPRRFLPGTIFKLTNEVKSWIAQEVENEPMPYKKIEEICSKYGLNCNTVKSFYARFKKSHCIHDKKGRPPIFDKDAKMNVRQLVTSGTYTPTVELVHAEIHHQAAATRSRRSQSTIHTGVSKWTRLRLEKELGMRVVNAEQTTNARDGAIKDPLNFVTYAAMGNYVANHLKVVDALNCNMDATSFTVGGSACDNIQAYMIGRKKVKKVVPSVGYKVEPGATSPGDGDLTKYSIKLLPMFFANGVTGDPVYIIADDNMTDEEFRVYEIAGLGVGVNIDNKGYLLITKSRSLNLAAYRWYYKTYVVNMVALVRKVFKLEDIDKYPCFLHLDGEAIQIDPIFSADILETLKLNNIHVGKVAASLTQAQQAADVLHLFKAPKTALHNIKGKNVKYQTTLLERLDGIFKEHNEWLNSEERGDARTKGRKKKRPTKKDAPDAIEFSTLHLKQAKYGLLRVQLVLQMTWKSHMIRESFEAIGMWPFSVGKVLGNCLSQFPEDEVVKTKSNLDLLTNALVQKGEITDDELVNVHKFNTCAKHKSKDKLVIYRRRALLITHPSVVQAYRQDKEVKAQEKEVKADKKRKRDAPKIDIQVGKRHRLVLTPAAK